MWSLKPPPRQITESGPQAHVEQLSYGRLHLLLCLVSLVVVLVSVNRKHGGTLAFAADNEFLRWVEINNMLLGLCTVVLYHLVAAHLTNGTQRPRRGTEAVLGVLFVLGVYLYALSLGDHEITNYLHGQFCSQSSAQPCRIIAFNDDVFSDLLFLDGFTVLNVVIMLTQTLHPATRPLRFWDNVLLAVNALLVGAAITGNVAFERADFDPYVVGMTAVFALVLLKRSPHQPMLRYYGIAYTVGIVATVLIRTV